MADDDDLVAAIAGHAADNGVVVSEAAVAVQFAPVGEDAIHVIEGVRPLGMAREFSLLPGGEMRLKLLAQGGDLIVQLLQLAAGFLIRPGGALQLIDLLFDALQFVLRAGGRFHHFMPIIGRIPQSLHLQMQQVV